MFTQKDKRMAKNYAAERNPTSFETNGIFVRERITKFVLQEVERAFLAGLDVYKPKWHKVADKDLPKEKKEYWCKVFQSSKEFEELKDVEVCMALVCGREVEEILNKHCNCELLSECIDGIRTRCSDFEEKKKWLLEGIELGYKKANEWHYIKDNDYPKEYKDLWICFITEDDMKDCVRGWYEYDFDEDKHIFKTVNEITQTLENVYAWKEIVFPEERD